MAALLDEFYEEISVFKAVVITADDEETYAMVAELEKRNHTVTFLDDDMDNADRALVHDRLVTFETSVRIIVLSYKLWRKYEKEIEIHVLPNQNLVAFGTLEEEIIRTVVASLQDSTRRGFGMSLESMNILRLSEVV